MNITSIWTRNDPLKKALVTLEDSMEDALKEELLLPVDMTETQAEQSMAGDYDGSFDDEIDNQLVLVSDTQGEPQDDRLTPHTKRRLMGHSTFETSQARIADEVGRIGEALANIAAATHMTREFTGDSFADIHRANDLETGNIAYAAENRRLVERVSKLEKLRSRYDQLVDVLKRREMKLMSEVETLREALSDSKLEVVEAHNSIVRGESLQSELRAELAARSGEAERHMRTNDSLREKNSGLMLELEMVQRKLGEMRRKADELSTLHAGDSARLAEMMSRVATEEAENIRLQKLADSLEARLMEAGETAVRLSSDLAESDKRHKSEAHALRQEVQSLTLRLQGAAASQGEAASEIDAARSKISDMEAERQLLEKKNSDLRAEIDGERRSRAANDDAPDGSTPELRRRQADQMRLEMEELRATVARLKRYEGLYTAAKGRAKAKADAAQGYGAAKSKADGENGHAKSLS